MVHAANSVTMHNALFSLASRVSAGIAALRQRDATPAGGESRRRLLPSLSHGPLLMLCLLLLPLSQLQADQLERHRLEFQQAVKAYEAGDYQRFRQLTERNKEYMLYPYLHYMDIQTRLATLTDVEVEDFLKNYADTPLAGQLKSLWIRSLAKQKRWKDFVEFYTQSSSTELRCFYFYNKYQLDTDKTSRERIIRAATKLWTVGESLPDACDPLFQILYDKKVINQDLYWKRVELAIGKGKYGLAKYLAKNLNKKDRDLVDAWIKVRSKPSLLLKQTVLRKNTERNQKIALQAMRRYARRDAEKARSYWPQVRKRYKFSRDEREKMTRYLALRAAYQLHPRAYTWLGKVNSNWVNQSVRVWRFRSALRQMNWKGLKRAVDQLKPSDLDEDEAQYWQARSAELNKEIKKARKIYKEVAKSTSYYGFMAADRISADYKFQSKPLNKDSRRLSLLQGIPGLQRSRELYLLDRLTDARREWYHAIRRFDEPKIKLAAVMAYNWQWYHNAITTIARTTHRSDYQLRFPTPYKDLVKENAERFDIDASWIYGIIRRESAYRIDANSFVGATGLMQLMPATARIQAKKLGMGRIDRSYLLTPEGNIHLGSAYLNNMLRRFSGIHAPATAAYNAGPRRVEKWLPDEKMPMDAWVDSIPYKETREYVKAVMAYATIFDWRLYESAKRISDRMGESISK